MKLAKSMLLIAIQSWSCPSSLKSLYVSAPQESPTPSAFLSSEASRPRNLGDCEAQGSRWPFTPLSPLTVSLSHRGGNSARAHHYHRIPIQRVSRLNPKDSRALVLGSFPVLQVSYRTLIQDFLNCLHMLLVASFASLRNSPRNW